ncbi:UNVERIFIED_CONTAM: 50S ribosomal protein L15, chloroplastic [Sesamum radiatum]|uniref:50S ribosomal protein L15, chloroplastic n=1 Tax=Sesamum radiatum TaxID=300843 RepID=A0AAW2VK27_SESRA
MAASLSSLSSTTHPQLHLSFTTLHLISRANVRTLKAKPPASGVQEHKLSSQNVRFRLDNPGRKPGCGRKQREKGEGSRLGKGQLRVWNEESEVQVGPRSQKGIRGRSVYRRIPKLRGIAGGFFVVKS